MLNIGDMIVYPSQGAGVIESVEERFILGERKKYYIMRISLGNVTVMIPMDTCDTVGIRDVISADEAKKVLDAFHKAPVEENLNWNKRQRDHVQKIKSGDIYQTSAVLKCLMYRDKTKGLSTSERKMLYNLRQIVLSELVLSKVAPQEDIEAILEDVVLALI